MLVDVLKLKICERGCEMMCLSSLVLIPSKSQLVLDSKDLTTSHKWLGPNGSKKRVAIFGLSGIRANWVSGSRSDRVGYRVTYASKNLLTHQLYKISQISGFR
jgi:hypothetical protein